MTQGGNRIGRRPGVNRRVVAAPAMEHMATSEAALQAALASAGVMAEDG